MVVFFSSCKNNSPGPRTNVLFPLVHELTWLHKLEVCGGDLYPTKVSGQSQFYLSANPWVLKVSVRDTLLCPGINITPTRNLIHFEN